jgi:hypothetical protein
VVERGYYKAIHNIHRQSKSASSLHGAEKQIIGAIIFVLDRLTKTNLIGAYSQQNGFRSQDVIAASVLAVRVIREMTTPQVAPED